MNADNTTTEAASVVFNKLKVHFLLQAEETISILNPYPELIEDFKAGFKLAWLSISDSDPEIRAKLLDYRPDNETDFPQRCASSYGFPQSAYVAFTGELLYLMGTDNREIPKLDARTPLVEEGLVCGALERKLACHYLRLIAAEIYTEGQEAQLASYLEKIKEFENTLCCDVPDLV